LVAFTANTHSEALAQCIDAGMDDYLTKPAELVTLRAKLAQWLGSEARLGRRAPRRAPRRPLRRAPIRSTGRASRSSPAVRKASAKCWRSSNQECVRTSPPCRSRWRARTATRLRRAAHRIKGSALTIGAERLAELASSVVDAPAGTDGPLLMSNAHALLNELQRVLLSARG